MMPDLHAVRVSRPVSGQPGAAPADTPAAAAPATRLGSFAVVGDRRARADEVSIPEHVVEPPHRPPPLVGAQAFHRVGGPPAPLGAIPLVAPPPPRPRL